MEEVNVIKLKATVSFENSFMESTISLMQRPDIEFFANDVQLNNRDEATGRFIPIDILPSMPVITILNNMDVAIRTRVKIEYSKTYNGNVVRTWENFYPIEINNEVMTTTIIENNLWYVDFGEDIRGGKVTVEYVVGENEWNDDNIETFIFYLRGVNPSRSEVIAYIEEQGYDDLYWFLIRLIRHESATGISDVFRNFNIGEGYSIESVSGLPNFGAPRGYGLGQIDNFGRLSVAEINTLSLDTLEIGETVIDNGRTVDRNGYIVASDNQVWSWKENIDMIITILNSKKQTIINKYNSWITTANNWNNNHPDNLIEQYENQQEGNIIFSSIESGLAGISDSVNEYFNENDNSNSYKSFIDACLIRYYNGGYYHKLNHNENQKPFWEIDRFSTQSGYYVEHICSQNE